MSDFGPALRTCHYSRSVKGRAKRVWPYAIKSLLTS